MLISPSGTIRFVTSDHKPDDLAEAKRIRSAGGSVSFGRVDGELAMSRSIGDYNYKQSADLKPEEQKVIAEPDCTLLTAESGEKLLICCDGLVEKLTNEQVVQFVMQEYKNNCNDPAAIVSKLLDYSLQRGSKDNMSALLVEFGDGSSYNSGDEFIPGPYSVSEDDKKFVEAYIADAKRHGIAPEKLIKMAKEQEAKRATEKGNKSNNNNNGDHYSDTD
jgi:serine/threonine protein phosphatase PrpC